MLFAQMSMAHKILMINDIHLDVNSTQEYSEPGTESSITLVKKVLSDAAEV